MKKMKGVVSMESPYDVYQDQRTRLRHQSLLQDYEDLQKVTPLPFFPPFFPSKIENFCCWVSPDLVFPFIYLCGFLVDLDLWWFVVEKLRICWEINNTRILCFDMLVWINLVLCLCSDLWDSVFLFVLPYSISLSLCSLEFLSLQNLLFLSAKFPSTYKHETTVISHSSVVMWAFFLSFWNLCLVFQPFGSLGQIALFSFYFVSYCP